MLSDKNVETSLPSNNTSRQSKDGIIGSSDDLILRFKRHHTHDSTKHFLLNYSHLFHTICQNTRREVETILECRIR